MPRRGRRRGGLRHRRLESAGAPITWLAFFRWSLEGVPALGSYEMLSPQVIERPRTAASDAVICDFGGVLTNHLVEAFAAFQDETGISTEQLGRGMQRVAERDGEYPLFRLERGELTRGSNSSTTSAGRWSRSSATGRSCTASARSTSRPCTRTSRCST